MDWSRPSIRERSDTYGMGNRILNKRPVSERNPKSAGLAQVFEVGWGQRGLEEGDETGEGVVGG